MHCDVCSKLIQFNIIIYNYNSCLSLTCLAHLSYMSDVEILVSLKRAIFVCYIFRYYTHDTNYPCYLSNDPTFKNITMITQNVHMSYKKVTCFQIWVFTSLSIIKQTVTKKCGSVILEKNYTTGPLSRPLQRGAKYFKFKVFEPF